MEYCGAQVKESGGTKAGW